MEHKVIAVYDQKLEAYMRPFYTPTIGAAIRGFQDEANRQDSEIHKHPEDYTLRSLATWDDTTGRFNNAPEIKIIAHADQMTMKEI